MTEQLGRLVPLATVEGSVLIARLDLLELGFDVGRLPYTLRILLENVLRANALGVGSPDEVLARPAS